MSGQAAAARRTQNAMPAVLLLNLGSPSAPDVPAVRRYLAEFLGDPLVMDRPKNPFLRRLLVNGLIIPARVRKSARAYQSVWTPAGAPLTALSERLRAKLAAVLGPRLPVLLAMRYGAPSIAEALRQAAGAGRLLVIPQYPHHAKSSWQTAVDAVLRLAPENAPGLRVEITPPYYADADYIAALHETLRPWLAQPRDHFLISYHGLPLRHIRESAPGQNYLGQTAATSAALARLAGLAPGSWSTAYQSRLAGEPWLGPDTAAELARLARAGKKNILLAAPSFTTDCLETLEELNLRARETFFAAGGETLHLAPCLNDSDAHVAFLKTRALRFLGLSTTNEP